MPVTFQLLRDPPVELCVLLAGACHPDDAARQAELRRLVARGPDWDPVLRLARRHHLQPLLYRGLQRAGWPRVPSSVQAGLGQALAANFRRNVALARQAKPVIRALGDRGIRVLPWKGIFLAQDVYGHLSGREVRDIDLLVSREDAVSAATVLGDLGFESLERLDQQQVLRHPETRIDVDLHWNVTPDFFPVGFDFDGLWERATDARLDRVAYRTPAAEDLVLLLAVQLAKDCWERRQRLVQLLKVCDVAELIRRSPDLDWDRVFRQAGERGVARVLNFALMLAADLAAARLPGQAEMRAGRDRGALALARQAAVSHALADPVAPPERNELLDLSLRLRQLVFYLRLRERPRDRWAYPAQVAASLVRRARRPGE